MRTLAITILFLLASGAAGQNPYDDYNAARAYRHYLNSPYTMKSYSSLQPGQSWGYQTPLERGRFWQTPGYYSERTSPWGQETYNLPPTRGGFIERRPIVVYPPPPVYPYPWPQ